MYSSICPYSLPYSHFSLKHMWKLVAEFTAVLSVIMPLPLIGGGIKWWCCLTSVWCLFVMYIGPKLRTERPRKTKIGTEVATLHVTRTPLLKSKGQRSRLPGRFTHHGVYASGSCSGGRGNVFTVWTYCYIMVCRLGGARHFGAHRGEGGEGWGISWWPATYSLF